VNYCPQLLGLAVVREPEPQLVQAFVVQVPDPAAGLCDDGQSLFGIAGGFVGEAPARPVHLDAAFHDQRVGDENVLRDGNGRMSLVGVHERHRGAEFLSPEYAVAGVAFTAEVEGVLHIGTVALHHLLVAREAVARQDDLPGAPALPFVVSFDGDA